MEHYYILRNNQESGPFTVKELKANGLFTTDLVWQDGESTCWKHPEEFDELKSLAKTPAPKPLVIRKSPLIASPSNDVQQQVSSSSIAYSSTSYAQEEDWKWQEEEILTAPSFEALKQKHAAKPKQRKVWKQPVNIAANLFGLVVLLLGVSMAAFMVKKAVDSIDWEPTVETAEAHSIEPDGLHRSNASHAALAAAMHLPAPDTTRLAVMEKVLVESPKPESKKPIMILAADHPAEQTQTSGNVASAEADQASKPVAETEETEASASPKEAENEKAAGDEKSAIAALQVSTNEYSVGMFGGISNLELTINNPSSKTVEKALVEVDFLKPNGKVVHTQTVEVAGIAAGGAKKVPVPNSSRGVSVRYRVVNL
jgi:hypothetical protein